VLRRNAYAQPVDSIRPVLRAAAITAFVMGTVAVLLQPPSLSGTGGLLALLAGAVALVLVTAWLTVLLMGRQSMGEQEFERLVRRTEELAREPGLAQEATEFELLVADAIDRLPEEFRRLLEDTPVVVSQRGAEVHAYGRYYGDTYVRHNWEPRIVIYQDTLERDFGHDPELLAQQVERTLRHELAHHIGWREEGVRKLGL
jgi:predicted Zn-dependent protease with MMP-like domain